MPSVIEKGILSPNCWFRLKLIIAFALIGMNAFAQYKSAAFQLRSSRTNIISVNNYIEKSVLLKPFTQSDPISGLSINARIDLHSDSGFIRILLVDDDNREYLVYETYPLLADSVKYTIHNTGEETILLDNIVPSSLDLKLRMPLFF